jgi:hypothetical protein
VRMMLAIGLLMFLFGCDVVPAPDGAGAPVNPVLPECAGIDDAVLVAMISQIDASADQGVERLDVLATGLESGCRDECFTCWQAVTDFVYFELR